jgi:hypothetical protein
MRHLVRLKVVPPDDRDFHAAIERAEQVVVKEGIRLDSDEAADRLQVLLRTAGYPATRVDCLRSLDEVLAPQATWTIRRDGA